MTQVPQEPIHPEVVEPSEPETIEAAGEQVSSPTKLIRIASMVRTMLEEVRQAPLDEEGRRHLRAIYERAVNELKEILSPELHDELQEMLVPLTGDAPSESQLRIAQAQLVGWLEGLFHGIQATLFTQQMATQTQLEQLRRQKSLEASTGDESDSPIGGGAYL